MSDSKKRASSPKSADQGFSENDFAETEMTYGVPRTRQPYLFVGLAWLGFALGGIAYLALYYFPDLSEWNAW